MCPFFKSRNFKARGISLAPKRRMINGGWHMFTQIEWLFFDVGSTLVDEGKANEHRIWDAIAGTDLSYEQTYARAVQLAKQNIAHPLKCLGLPLTPWHSEDEAVYPQAAECLAALHKAYRIGIIANQSPGTAARMKQYGLSQHLDLIIASAEEGLEKPDPRIFQLALSRAGCLPQRAVMIGDRLDNDIAPAKRLGFKTIWIRQGFGGMGTPASEQDTPDCCVNSLGELAVLLG